MLPMKFKEATMYLLFHFHGIQHNVHSFVFHFQKYISVCPKPGPIEVLWQVMRTATVQVTKNKARRKKVEMFSDV